VLYLQLIVTKDELITELLKGEHLMKRNYEKPVLKKHENLKANTKGTVSST
jgi:hypothetical protein